MSRLYTLFRGDCLSSFRSPAVLWLVLVPFAVTFLLRVVFVTLFDPVPRIGIYSENGSALTRSLVGNEALEVTAASSREELRSMVRDDMVDGGLVLNSGFDDSLLAGERPLLDLSFGGGSDPVNGLVIFLAVMDAVRAELDVEPPVLVTTAGVRGSGQVPFSAGLVPGVVLLILIVSGIFVPAYLLVREKESGTLSAVLVTPAKLSEVILSKALLGFLLTLAIAMVTLVLNGVPLSLYPQLLATLAVGAVMCCCIGVMYGALAGDVRTLYTMIKSLNILLAGPVAFYMVSGIPEWAAMMFPTYWFIDPLYRITLEKAGLGSIIPELAVAAAIALLLTVPMVLLSRRMYRKLAVGGG